MTDRVKGFTVTLDKDIRIDDVQELMNAISMLKGIAHVEASITTAGDHMNREKIKMEYRDKFITFLNDELT